MALEIPFQIKVMNPSADNDELYGTYDSIQEALTATASLREVGRKVGIVENGSVVEYWFQDGITDSDLVLYTVGGASSTFPDGIQLGANPNVGAFSVGKFYYDPIEQTFTGQTGGGVSLQLNAEDVVLGYNGTGVTIPNGSCVYKNGAILDFPIFNLAKADDLLTSDVIGITTQDILPNEYGMAVTRGKIHGLNTNGLLTTDKLYLSDTVAGAFTKVETTNPLSYVIEVAQPLKIDVADGSIYCKIDHHERVVDLLDVIAKNHVQGDTLVSNGSKFVLKPASPVVGSASSFYLDATTAVADNLTLSITPSPYPEIINTKASTSATSPVFFERFTSGSLGRESIPAGKWIFNIYASINNTGGSNYVNFRINRRVLVTGMTGTFTGTGATRTFTVTGGTPFVPSDANASRLLASLIETPTQTAWISSYISSSQVTVTLTDPLFVNTTNVNLNAIYYYLFNGSTEGLTQTAVRKYVVETFQPSFVTNLTDSIVIAYFCSTDANKNVSLHYGGATNYSNFQSPISTKHNDLAGINEDDVQHLTQTQLAVVNATSGTNTGDQIGATLIIDSSGFDGLLNPSIANVQLLAQAVDDLAIPVGTFAQDITVSLSGGKTFGKYTTGQTIPSTGKTAEEVMRLVAIEELFPTLVSPDNAFALTQAGLREIGETVTLSFNATFSRGSITPAYTTSGFRSGLPTTYEYTGFGLPVSVASSTLSNAQTVAGYVVLPSIQSWTNIVTMLAGEQPVGSAGSNYSTPWPAGDTTTKTVSITGVYPWFGTSVMLGTFTKQPLALMNSAYVQITMVAEDGVGKQKADFPIGWSAITGVQFFNTNNNSWEWINGSKGASLSVWDISSENKTIQGQTISYTTYTHNDATTGSRQLRFYTT
jgi:hypothetical protein